MRPPPPAASIGALKLITITTTDAMAKVARTLTDALAAHGVKVAVTKGEVGGTFVAALEGLTASNVAAAEAAVDGTGYGRKSVNQSLSGASGREGRACE